MLALLLAIAAQDYVPVTGPRAPLGEFARSCSSSGGAPGAYFANAAAMIHVYDGPRALLTVWLRGGTTQERISGPAPRPFGPSAWEYHLGAAGATTVHVPGPAYLNLIGQPPGSWVEYCIKVERPI